MRRAVWLLLWLPFSAPAAGEVPAPPPPCAADAFPDVPSTSPFCRWIRDAAADQILKKCDATNFCPQNPVTREQLALALERARTWTDKAWGEGRPNVVRHGYDFPPFGEVMCQNVAAGIRYGLSNSFASWDGAAAACPAGTWVCRMSDIVAGQVCDTQRSDTTCDSMSCTFNNFACADLSADNHEGWLADHFGSGATPFFGRSLRESGFVSVAYKCDLFPVWCCSY